MTRLAEVKAERDRERARGDCYLTALNLVAREQPDAIERWSDDDGGDYEYRL
jgi:hypothetical protein